MKKLALFCLLSLSSVCVKTMDDDNKNSPSKNSSQAKNGQPALTASTADEGSRIVDLLLRRAVLAQILQSLEEGEETTASRQSLLSRSRSEEDDLFTGVWGLPQEVRPVLSRLLNHSASSSLSSSTSSNPPPFTPAAAQQDSSFSGFRPGFLSPKNSRK